MLLLSIFQDPVVGIIFLAIIIFSLTLHEFAHALVANWAGDPTAKIEGRLTINPLAHLDLVGSIMLLIIGFGWGKPVPVNPAYFRNKSSEIWVSLAGIITNLIIALIISIILKVLVSAGISGTHSFLVQILNLAAVLNIALASFNILPIPPLDGSHLIEPLMSPPMRETYQNFGPYLLLGIIIYDQVSGSSIFLQLIRPLILALSKIIGIDPTMLVG
ncbi:MAG: site-2 protease family protein [Patescibacteria group bacterium]|jgi:Zn-dependent protease